MKKLPIGRTVAYVVAGLLLVLAVHFFLKSGRLHREAEAWAVARPVEMPVDLSKPGHYSSSLVQVCPKCHSQVFCLSVPPQVAGKTAPTELLAGLQAKCTITDGAGKVIVSEALTSALPWEDRLFRRAIPLFSICPFERGTYTLSLSVTEGAAALAGVRQVFLARYRFCGIEFLPAFLCKVYAIVSLVLAGVISIVTVVVTKKGKHH